MIARDDPSRAGVTPDDSTIILDHLNTIYPSDERFNNSEVGVLQVGATNQVIVSFTVKSGMLGIVRQLALQTNALLFLNFVNWRVRRNRVAIFGLHDIKGPMGTYFLPYNDAIPIFRNETIDICATNLAAFPIPGVNAFLRGHTFAGTPVHRPA